jgi:hypothetical protein
VSQFVILAKSREAGASRDPERIDFSVYPGFRISFTSGELVRNDGFEVL